MNKYVIGNVYNLQLTHKSFSWRNGLFICLKTDTDIIWGCSLDEQGNPQKFEDGRYMSFCTGINNPEIFPTKLKYNLEKDFKHN